MGAAPNILFFLLTNLPEFCWWLPVYAKPFAEHRSPWGPRPERENTFQLSQAGPDVPQEVCRHPGEWTEHPECDFFLPRCMQEASKWRKLFSLSSPHVPIQTMITIPCLKFQPVFFCQVTAPRGAVVWVCMSSAQGKEIHVTTTKSVARIASAALGVMMSNTLKEMEE